jgi:hypothetical protein
VLKINKNLQSILKQMKDQIEVIKYHIEEAKEITLHLSTEQVNYFTGSDKLLASSPANYFTNHEQILLMKKIDNYQKVTELIIDLGRLMEGFSEDCARYGVRAYKLSDASEGNKNKLGDPKDAGKRAFGGNVDAGSF